MSNNQKKTDPSKALDIALELIKQFITLSSGVLAISATFLPKIKEIPLISFVILIISWIALMISIIMGNQTISIMVNSQLNEEVDWSTGKGYNYGKFCKWLFIVGLIAFTLFALTMIFSKSSPESDTNPLIYNIFH